MKSKKIVIYIATFVASLLGLWLLLIVTSMIPNDAIADKLEQSALTYQDKEGYQLSESGRLNEIEDNYADAILLNVLWNIDSNNPVISSLDTKYYDGESTGEGYGLYAAVHGAQPNTDYSRYWHGSVVLLRPLLLFLDVNGIKLVGFGVILLLLAVNCMLLVREKLSFMAVGLIVSLLGVQIWNVRLSLEYMPAFLIALALCPCFLWMERKGNVYVKVLCIIGGVMTAFFDFLTTETVTLLLPLILVMAVRASKGRLGKRRENMLLLLQSGLLWAASYGMTFLVKWTAVTAATGQNKFLTAVTSAEKRMYGSVETEQMSGIGQVLCAIPANLSTLFGGTVRVDGTRVVVGLLLTVLVVFCVYYLFRTEHKNREITWILLILGLVPYLRFLVLNNHSYLHEFFSYRAQCAAILSLWAIVSFQIELPFGKSRSKSRNKSRRK